jgi:pseudouridine synthase
LIRAGRVRVNGEVAGLGAAVAPSDIVLLDDRPVSLRPEPFRYVLLNKPTGVVSTLRDPQRRRTIRDLLTGIDERLYPVGRLDVDSSGLLLCTNDGELARAITHPSHEVIKTYEVGVEGRPSAETLANLSRGMTIEGRKTAPAKFSEAGRKAESPRITLLEVQLREGRKRQIRKMLAAVGHPVVSLERVAIGPLRDSHLPPGHWRDLRPRELAALRGAAGLDS